MFNISLKNILQAHIQIHNSIQSPLQNILSMTYPIQFISQIYTTPSQKFNTYPLQQKNKNKLQEKYA